MTNKEYRKEPGVSRSDLWLMSKTPMHYKYHLSAPEEETPALLFGSAMHKMALEPEDFMKEYAVLPGSIDRRTKRGKEMYEEFVDKIHGRKVVTEEQYIQILEMQEALKQNELAWKLLSGGIHEESYFWTDAETGLRCKIRPDVVTGYENRPLIVDYKTTDSCADGHFERSCSRYGYKLQAGMYTEGMFQTMFQEYGFAFVAQEKTPPYASRVYICDQDFIDEGHDQFRTYMGILKYCMTTNDWYGYEGPDHLPTVLGGENSD